jgi:hypothetical protein
LFGGKEITPNRLTGHTGQIGTAMNPVSVSFDPSVILSPADRRAASERVLLSTGKFSGEAASATATALQAQRGTPAFDRACDSLHARGLLSRSGWQFRNHV